MMTGYRFPVRTGEAARFEGAELEWQPGKPERGLIGDRQAASYAEYRVAQVLWYLRLDFRYKVSVLHTPYVVDFYLFNGAEWLALDVVGGSGRVQRAAQALRLRVIKNALPARYRVLNDFDLQTFDQAVAAVRAVL
jgi:hypothetical protein